MLSEFGAHDNSLLDIVFGKFNPSARLPFELPSSMELAVGDVYALDLSNIENIAVLRGESATQLYGDKGKNGVILITTKK